MDNPRLSIIVPVFNVEKYVRRSIDSILNQTFTDFDLILIDDGSADSSGNICDEYAVSDSRVRVIHQKHAGVSDARNKGIDASRAEIIGFVDSDDAICTNMFEEMIHCMDSNSSDIVCVDSYTVRHGVNFFGGSAYENDKLLSHEEAVNGILEGTIDNAVWNKIYKREIIGGIRFPVGRVYEDVATVYKFIDQAEKVNYICKPFYYYYKRKGSITRSSFNSKGRYDCFCGYKERAEFAEQKQLNCVERCEVIALQTALSALTAFYAMNESTFSEKYLDVTNYIKAHSSSRFVSRLKAKHQFLLYCFKYCPSVYKLYAGLSSWSKKIN